MISDKHYSADVDVQFNAMFRCSHPFSLDSWKTKRFYSLVEHHRSCMDQKQVTTLGLSVSGKLEKWRKGVFTFLLFGNNLISVMCVFAFAYIKRWLLCTSVFHLKFTNDPNQHLHTVDLSTSPQAIELKIHKWFQFNRANPIH